MQKYKRLEEFLEHLDSNKRQQVYTLRELILSVEPRLEERIKWNAPSYALDGEDRITFNLMNKQALVKLVLHMGTTRKEDKTGAPIMKDESGIIEWHSDVRGTITFTGIEDVNSKLAALKVILGKWLATPVTA